MYAVCSYHSCRRGGGKGAGRHCPLPPNICYWQLFFSADISSCVPTISIGEGVACGAAVPFSWADIHFIRGNFSERTIGNSGDFSHVSPDLFVPSRTTIKAPINLKPSYNFIDCWIAAQNLSALLLWKINSFFCFTKTSGDPYQVQRTPSYLSSMGIKFPVSDKKDAKSSSKATI